MTQAEFKAEFKALHARYPGFVMPDPKQVEKIYFEELRQFPLVLFKRALPEVLEASPLFFPTLSVVKLRCEAFEEQEAAARPLCGFLPHDHGCQIEGIITMEGIQVLLHLSSPYEAIHVKCQGVMIPRCSACGADQPPFINPFIAWLMDTYPNDAECWNSAHKGTLICRDCERKGIK